MIASANRDEFDSLGPHQVRSRISASLYNEEKQREAHEWLDENDHGADRALVAQQISIARDAKDAAWAAARAARAANTRATIALIIATISAIAAICAVIVPRF